MDESNGRGQSISNSTMQSTPFNSSKDIKRIGSFPVVVGCLSITIVLIAILIGWKLYNGTLIKNMHRLLYSYHAV